MNFEKPPMESEEELPSGEAQNESFERENQFRERLRKLVPAFLEARERMGIGEHIGFGFLKNVHEGGYSLGSSPEIKKSKSGTISCSVPGFLTGAGYENISDKEAGNILVMPNLSKRHARVVSIYDPFEEFGSQEKEVTKLIDASDEVFVGLIVHELAHEFDSSPIKQLPKDIHDVLKEREKREASALHTKSEVSADKEAETEIKAALFGYKEQILAKINFNINRFKTFGPYPLRTGGKTAKDMIEELEYRKQQVLRYCP